VRTLGVICFGADKSAGKTGVNLLSRRWADHIHVEGTWRAGRGLGFDARRGRRCGLQRSLDKLCLSRPGQDGGHGGRTWWAWGTGRGKNGRRVFPTPRFTAGPPMRIIVQEMPALSGRAMWAAYDVSIRIGAN